jgi:hypothetical protein
MIRQIVTLLLIFSGALFGVAHAWQGKQDNKTEAELVGMQEDELAEEAEQVCLKGGTTRKPESQAEQPEVQERRLEKQGEAKAYLESIGQVLGKLHNGEPPKWIKDMESAASTGDPTRCIDTRMELIGEKLKKAGEEAERKIKKNKVAKPKKGGS